MEVSTIASSTATAAPPAVAGNAPTTTPAPVGKVASEPSPPQLAEAVSKINKSMASQSRGLEFSVDATSKRTVVKVVDRQTNELIRQIPTVEALEIAKALDHAQGLLIKQTA